MTSVSELRKKAAARAGAKTQMYSTSQGRANFAEALGVTQVENAVIGFDRYGRLVAALVPIDAVRMLAGQAQAVEPAVRAKIERMARLFLYNAPTPGKRGRQARAHGKEVTEARAAFKTKSRRKDNPRKARKKAKAERAKRGPRVTRKI
jgi:hypothetical protein